MKAHLLRLRDDGVQTLGALVIYDGVDKVFECVTLELPWKGNKTNVSCIPKGVYNVVHRESTKYGDHLHIEDVNDRSYILIHVANYVSQLKGCIALGKRFADINGDDALDVVSSRNTLKKLVDIIPIEGITLEII
jgi:hypothetical protein